VTSGRRPCIDCGRNSPQGRHVECHVLALLREARAEKSGRPLIDTEAAIAVYGETFGRHFWAPERIAQAVRRLRAKGYRIPNYYSGYYRLTGEPNDGERMAR
jgi:hypothetical protein